jgi:predicted ribosome quality control (RQC) complex YloA/Tae2 family protein
MKRICLIFIFLAFSFQLFAEESTVETYHPHKTAGISLIVAGAAVAAGGIAGFHIASDKEFDKYKKMKDYDNAFEAVNQGEKESEYLNRAKKYRKKANTYRSLEIAAGIIGGELFLTGIILAAIKEKKTEKEVTLTNISATPSKDGFYASVGFEF